MKYINIHTINIDLYNISSIYTPPFSKLLKVICVNNQFDIISESPEMSNNGTNNTKKFNFRVISGLHKKDEFMDNNFEFFDSIRVQKGDFVEYYHIFFEEEKSISEKRDDKLNDIIDE